MFKTIKSKINALLILLTLIKLYTIA